MCNLLLSGNANEWVAQYICGTKLIPIDKTGGKIIPIAVGETFRRLVSKCCCNQLNKKFGEILHPQQMGVSTRRGIETVIHTVKSPSQLLFNQTIIQSTTGVQ